VGRGKGKVRQKRSVVYLRETQPNNTPKKKKKKKKTPPPTGHPGMAIRRASFRLGKGLSPILSKEKGTCGKFEFLGVKRSWGLVWRQKFKLKTAKPTLEEKKIQLNEALRFKESA